MKPSAIISATIGAVALTGLAMTMPAQARGFGPAIAGGVIAGGLVAGAATSAYAYDTGPYAYDGGRVYYEHRGHPYRTFGTYDESQHGGQPSYSRPLGE
jgi:hypothetical protein